MTAAATHVVVMPSYNTGVQLKEVVTETLRHWPAVIVVIDGSDDGSQNSLHELSKNSPSLTVLILRTNSGKGAAVLAGAHTALACGFTHALVMDADGQHPAASITEFMEASQKDPQTMILGRPIFPTNVPAARLHGRKLSVWLVHLEVLGPDIADPLFGFRVLPLEALRTALGPRRSGRRYDFDTESAVRLCWAGVASRNLDAPVRYFSRAEGGVSHFNYLRDNATLMRLHLRLLAELALWRWAKILWAKRRLTGAAKPVLTSATH